jgi:hypothetical protein
VTIVQVIKSNEFFYLLKIFEINGFIVNEPFSTTDEPKGSGTGKKSRDFQGF